MALTAIRLAVGPRFDHAVRRGAGRVGHLLGAALFGLLYVLLFVPAHVLGGRHRRKDRATPPTWLDRRPTAEGPERRLGASGAERPHRRRLTLVTAVGMIAVVLLVDQGVGAAWNRISPPDETSDPPPSFINVSGSAAPADPRAEDPAMGGVPWARQYFEELNSVPSSFWPFIGFVNGDYAGRYVNGSGWTRTSYEPSGDVTGPLLTFYGGSTMFGIGQRDGHTIPSELARLAESEGYPVRVRNHGMSGFVSWQEMLLFEQQTAGGERPLRAVFYDGTNDVNAQRQPQTFGEPTVTEVDALARALSSSPDTSPTPEAEAPAGDGWWDLYRRNSAIDRATTAVREAIDQPAGAMPTRWGQDVGRDDVPTVEEQGRAAASVYARSRSMIESIASRAGVRPMFFWQPVPNWDDETTPYPHATEALTEPTVPVVDCLADHPEVYLSDAHTNELGARLVAGCLWEELEPVVAQWYEDQGLPRQPAKPEVLTTLAEPVPPVDLGLQATDLGDGWADSIDVPNVVADCAAQLAGGGAEPRIGPSFSRSTADAQARFVTAAIELSSPAEAERLGRALLGAEGTRCIADLAAERLAVDGEVAPEALDASEGATAVEGFVAAVRFRALERDGQLAGAVVPRGSDLLVLQATSSEGGWAPDAIVRATSALAP